MLRSKKTKTYTVAELRIYIRELTIMRDSLYKKFLIDRVDYQHLTKSIDSLRAAMIRVQTNEQNNQGRLI